MIYPLSQVGVSGRLALGTMGKYDGLVGRWVGGWKPFELRGLESCVALCRSNNNLDSRGWPYV